MSEAKSFAIVDLSGGQGSSQNKLGIFLANLNSNLMIDAALGTAVTTGAIVILHSVRSDDATLTSDSSATWQIWLGAPQPDPKLDGTGSFTVASNAPSDAVMSGAIAAGKFSGSAAQVTLELALFAGSDPLRVKIVTPHIEAKVTSTGCTDGRLQGAITKTDVNDQVAPFLATYLDGRIGADDGCRENTDDCEDANATIKGLLDTNRDGTISTPEVQAFVATALPPDVDVLGANGQPGHDTQDDSISVALGFSCAKGTYVAPTE